MTGILSLLRELLQLYRPTTIYLKSNFWTWARIAFIVSAIVVWSLEHQKVNELQNQLNVNKPKFEILVNSTTSGTLNAVKMPNGTIQQSGGTVVFINVELKNFGTPSIARGWHLTVKSSSLNIKRTSPTLIADGLNLMNNGKLFAIFHANNRLEERMKGPLQHGDDVGGWLMFMLPGVDQKQFEEAEKTIYVRDIYEHEYSVSFSGTPRGSLMYYPGSGDNPFLLTPQQSPHTAKQVPTSDTTPTPIIAVPPPTPNLASIRIASQKQIVSTDSEFPYALEIILQTDKIIERPAFAIEFNKEIGRADVGYMAVVQSGTMMESYLHKRKGIRDKTFYFTWDFPAFTPESPIWIRAFSKEDVRAIGFHKTN